jgi:transcriptional regulator with XRE-family HTH domain
MTTFGKRLQDERRKLDMTQPELAKIGGITKSSQVNYEGGKRNPDTAYLAAIAQIGVDVQYIITGERSINWPVKTAVQSSEHKQVAKNELLDTLELIYQESGKGLELLKKMG